MQVGSWGLVLNGVGGVLVAIGQAQISAVVYQWLRSLDMTVGHVIGRGDIIRITGIDEKMKTSLSWNRWLSIVGWTLFVVGILFQIAANEHWFGA